MNSEAVLADAGPFEKMVTFEISSAELEQAMNRASRRISREVNIRGFRPGRAPRRLVERRVGTDRVRGDALDDLVPVRVGQILSQTEIVPAVPSLLESVTDTANGAVKLEVRVTTWPRLESVPDYRGRRIEVRPPPPISEEVTARLEQLRHMYAPLQTVHRASEEGDFVMIDMTVMEGDRLIESLALDGFSYEVGAERLTAEIDESLLNRKAGDRFEIVAPLPGWLPSDPQAGEDSGGPAPAMGLYRIRVVEVQSRSLPDLDDEWASEYTGHDSLEELREEMSGELEEEHNAAQWEELVGETMKEAISELDLQIPERLETAQTELLLRNQLASLERHKLDYPTFLERTGLEHEQLIRVLRERAVTGLKEQILAESVIAAQNLVVEDAEVMEALRAVAQESGDSERFRQAIDQGVDLERFRSDMLTDRAQAFLAMQVQPFDAGGEPVAVQPPAQVKAWFDPVSKPEQIPNPGADVSEALYEAEVIDDPYFD